MMKIENYFESDEFIEALEPISEMLQEADVANKTTLIGYIINSAINYSIIFKEEDKFSTKDLSRFVRNLSNLIVNNISVSMLFCIDSNYDFKSKASNLYLEELLSRLNIDKDALNDKEIRKIICSYFVNLQNKPDSYIYHSFNEVFLESIKENGINPNINYTPQQEIDTITKIFRKHELYGNIFGWQDINCRNKVSYSCGPLMAYYHGMNSPEWFYSFTCRGKGALDPIPFNAGDYETARNNILNLMNKNNFTEEEIKYIMDFFNKNWNLYANNTAILAIIPVEFTTEEMKDENERNKKILEKYDYDVIDTINYETSKYSDWQTTEPIDVSKAVFVKMPRYNVILKRLEAKKAASKVEEEIALHQTIR